MIAMVFKARYFRNTDIMKAGLGNNPSFVRRSLCWGRELIRQTLGWVVVNGKDIEANGRE